MLDLGSVKAWATSMHDTIVLEAVDILMRYAEGAYRREAMRLQIMDMLRQAATSNPVLLLTSEEVKEALTKWREQEERSEFFGDKEPETYYDEECRSCCWPRSACEGAPDKCCAECTHKPESLLGDPLKSNPAGPGRFA